LPVFILHERYQPQFPERCHADFCRLDGETFKRIQNRRTFRIERTGQGFFIKCHQGVGWREIFKNLLHFKLPVLGAGNEWRAIHRLAALGVDTMVPVAYGREGLNPAQQRSFLVTEALTHCISLEDYCATWRQQPPRLQQKRHLIRRLAWMARTLHDNGVNHRDFYLCHFLLQQPWDGTESGLGLYLIDLHRVQIRAKTPWRWRIKDLAALYYSAQGLGLTQRDLACFLHTYTQGTSRDWLRRHPRAWPEILKRTERLLAKELKDRSRYLMERP
jgi:heptose I phosphotransferase